jgi:cation:H+ antiporter
VDPVTWPVAPSIALLGAMAVVLVTAGVRFTKVVDTLADRTGLGEAFAGAVLLGATTSIPGLITTVTVAADGDASFAVSNGIGGIAAQTTFLAVADLTYRHANLEHAAASVPNLTSSLVLVSMIGLVLAAAGSPDIGMLGLHPASYVLIGIYLYGLVLTRRAGERPAWRPERTPETVTDEPEPDSVSRSTGRLWGEFATLAAVVAVAGWLVARSGLAVAKQTGLSGVVVGATITAVITSLPELVTVLTAVRIGALTLAVGDIIGGNTFDVLFVAAADIAYRGGSVYHAIDDQSIFLLAVTVVLTAVLAAGLVQREKRAIGFEGVGILAFYGVAVVSLVVGG